MITARKRGTGLAAAAGALGGVLALTALGGTSHAATGGNEAGSHPAAQTPAGQAPAGQTPAG
ncbi:hypothetical protein ACWEQZ_33680, partial [Streptomyces spiralis]